MSIQTSKTNMGIGNYRKAIDKIDTEILKLLNARASFVKKIGELKHKNNSKLYVPERESKIFAKITKINEEQKGCLPNASLKNIFREIISASIALEGKIKIAYLGPAGTWTHQAALKKFGNSLEFISCNNINEVFNQVEKKIVNYGVVPIENSHEGLVNHTLDRFSESNLKICGQIMLPIEHCLMSPPLIDNAKIKLSDITKIYSHAQVFGQCQKWFAENCPNAELTETNSTSQAAKIVKETDSANTAVAGSELIAKIYNLEILAEKIQDSSSNMTRFFIAGHDLCQKTGNDKTSLMFALQNKPGALADFLRPFQEKKINLTKIESRPSRRQDWEYYFFIETLGHIEDKNLKSVLDEITEKGFYVKILGSYPIS